MPTFWRLMTFLRPYRRAVAWSFVLAGGALIGTVLIPFLTGLATNAIRGHHHRELLVLAGSILLSGLVRLGFSVLRRLIAGRVSLAVEVDLRETLYGQLQRLTSGFFARPETGQRVSAATVART